MFCLIPICADEKNSKALIHHFNHRATKKLSIGTKYRKNEVLCPSLAQIVDAIVSVCPNFQGDGYIFRNCIPGFNLNDLFKLNTCTNRNPESGFRLDFEFRDVFLTKIAPRWLTNVLSTASKYIHTFYNEKINYPIPHLMIVAPLCDDQKIHYDSEKKNLRYWNPCHIG